MIKKNGLATELGPIRCVKQALNWILWLFGEQDVEWAGGCWLVSGKDKTALLPIFTTYLNLNPDPRLQKLPLGNLYIRPLAMSVYVLPKVKVMR